MSVICLWFECSLSIGVTVPQNPASNLIPGTNFGLSRIFYLILLKSIVTSGRSASRQHTQEGAAASPFSPPTTWSAYLEQLWLHLFAITARLGLAGESCRKGRQRKGMWLERIRGSGQLSQPHHHTSHRKSLAQLEKHIPKQESLLLPSPGRLTWGGSSGRRTLKFKSNFQVHIIFLKSNIFKYTSYHLTYWS